MPYSSGFVVPGGAADTELGSDGDDEVAGAALSMDSAWVGLVGVGGWVLVLDLGVMMIAGDAGVIEANADLVSDGVPSCAITRLRVSGGAVAIIGYPSTDHLDPRTRHRPA